MIFSCEVLCMQDVFFYTKVHQSALDGRKISLHRDIVVIIVKIINVTYYKVTARSTVWM